ncbi:MAG: 2-oxoacid:acceptor oxidoreductase subunit alpha [Armatimonadota bacterium]
MMNSKVKFMQGNEACAEGAIAAGCRFFAGYPITPSSEIAEILARRLPQVGGKFIQMEDEIAAMAAVCGASLTGTKALTATSGPGFSLKQENLGYASFTEIPCVVVNVMRAGPSTGSPTSPAQADVMQARWGTHGDHPIIVLSCSSVKDMYELTVKSFNLSERFRVPVIMLSDEVVAHMREKVDLETLGKLEIIDRKKPNCSPEEFFPYKADPETDVPPMASFGDGYRYHVTGLTHGETGFTTQKPNEISALIERLHRKIEDHKDEIIETRNYYLDDAEIAVFAYGCTSRSALRAVRGARERGIKAGLIQPVTLWPFPDELIHEVAAQVDAFIVPEMNMGMMVREVERAAHGQAEVIGQSLVTWEMFTPAQVLAKIEEVHNWATSNSISESRRSRTSGAPAAATE